MCNCGKSHAQPNTPTRMVKSNTSPLLMNHSNVYGNPIVRKPTYAIPK
jgi:hypothetical protein